MMLGLRLENTHVKYSGSQFDADEEKTTRTPYESDSYLNVLPSVLVKYDVNDDFKVRASFTNTIARPKYSALHLTSQLNAVTTKFLSVIRD